MIFINTNTTQIFISGLGNMIINVVIGSFALEQMNDRVRIHTVSLPVTRKAIVVSRFVSALVIIFANFAIHLVVFNMLQAVLKPEAGLVMSPQVIMYLSLDMLFKLALYHFFFYRLNLIAMIIVYFLPVTLYGLLRPKGLLLNEIIMGDPFWFAIWGVSVIGLFAFSYFSAYYYFNTKDI